MLHIHIFLFRMGGPTKLVNDMFWERVYKRTLRVSSKLGVLNGGNREPL